MAGGEQVADEAVALAGEAARLEAALERIAAARRIGHEPVVAMLSAASGQVAERLDVLIAELRLVLAEQAD